MINNLIRIIQIIYLFIKYDVDKMLVDSSNASSKFYFYILPWNWFRTKPVKNIPEKIKMMLEELGPIFVKLGQVISTRKDLLTDDIANELSKLQDHVKPFPKEFFSFLLYDLEVNSNSFSFGEFEPTKLITESFSSEKSKSEISSF